MHSHAFWVQKRLTISTKYQVLTPASYCSPSIDSMSLLTIRTITGLLISFWSKTWWFIHLTALWEGSCEMITYVYELCRVILNKIEHLVFVILLLVQFVYNNGWQRLTRYIKRVWVIFINVAFVELFKLIYNIICL